MKECTLACTKPDGCITQHQMAGKAPSRKSSTASTILITLAVLVLGKFLYGSTLLEGAQNHRLCKGLIGHSETYICTRGAHSKERAFEVHTSRAHTSRERTSFERTSKERAFEEHNMGALM